MNAADRAFAEIFRRLKTIETRPQGFNSGNVPEITVDEITGSATYTDLATVGPTISGLEVPGTGRLLIIVSAIINPGAGEAAMSFAISGDHTIAATDNSCLLARAKIGTSSIVLVPGLIGGGTINVTAKYRSDGSNTAHFSNRSLLAAQF